MHPFETVRTSGPRHTGNIEAAGWGTGICKPFTLAQPFVIGGVNDCEETLGELDEFAIDALNLEGDGVAEVYASTGLSMTYDERHRMALAIPAPRFTLAGERSLPTTAAVASPEWDEAIYFSADTKRSRFLEWGCHRVAPYSDKIAGSRKLPTTPSYHLSPRQLILRRPVFSYDRFAAQEGGSSSRCRCVQGAAHDAERVHDASGDHVGSVESC